MIYRDRAEAGKTLAGKLQDYTGKPDVLVLGLPRGGVPVAFEIAMTLNAPLDLITVRKLGVPGEEELAMGAIATGGIQILNPDVVRALAIPNSAIEAAACREMIELERRENAYRGGRPPASIKSKSVILVDDALATGSSMLAAIRAVRFQDPAKIIVAVPVAPPEACREIGDQVDEIVCASTPPDFRAVSLWYENFSQTTDEEVEKLYEAAIKRG